MDPENRTSPGPGRRAGGLLDNGLLARTRGRVRVVPEGMSLKSRRAASNYLTPRTLARCGLGRITVANFGPQCQWVPFLGMGWDSDRHCVDDSDLGHGCRSKRCSFTRSATGPIVADAWWQAARSGGRKGAPVESRIPLPHFPD
jgi:hypothetical protein